MLVRVFIGGACQSELTELPDDQLREIATDELQSLIGARGAPIFSDVARWPGSMPQYHLGHCELVERIEQRRGPLAQLRPGRQCLPRRRHSQLHSQRRTGRRARGGRGPSAAGKLAIDGRNAAVTADLPNARNAPAACVR